MAFSVISISSDSVEESVGTSTARVILFGMILTTVPATAPIVDLPVIHDDTPRIPTDTPTISPIVPAIPPIAPTSQYTPHSFALIHLIVTFLRDPHQRTRIRPLLLDGGPIPVGRPYRTQPNGDSSSQTSSNSHSDISSYSSSRHSSSGHPLSDSPCDSPTATSVRPSCKRCRSHTSSVHIASFVPRALSLVRVDLLPPRKRIRYFDSETDFEVSLEEGYVPYVPREIGLGVNVEDSYEPYTEPDIDPDTTAKEEAESSTRGTIEIRVDRVTHPVVLDDTAELVREDSPELVSADRSLEVMQRVLDVVMQELYDHMVEIPVHRVKVIESVQRDQGHRIVVTSQQSATMSERIGTLEWDNVRLRGLLNVERTVGVDAAYAMTWKALMKLMTKTAYNQRFQELTLLCTRMVLKEEDQVEKYIGGLLDKIQRNVIVVEPVRLQDAIRIANNLMDQKLKGYAIKNDENKRRGPQLEIRQVLLAMSVEDKDITEAKARAYEIRRRGANPDSNVIMGTFLLNNRYAFKLFDSGAGKSFVSTTLSALIDVILSTLDTSYAIELADGRISKTDVILEVAR
nr:putative reverse transcriptase domain-containing protein [Tanacetum cinerariifolium]